jgi:hypothetical protein
MRFYVIKNQAGTVIGFERLNDELAEGKPSKWKIRDVAYWWR